MRKENFNFLKKGVIGLYFFLLPACKVSIHPPLDISNILVKAGENKKEFENAIRYYSRLAGDSLKLKAAYFLIRNMDGMQTLDTNSVTVNKVYFDALSDMWGKNKKAIFNPIIPFTIDSVNRVMGFEPQFSSAQYNDELKTISSAFLINNIEQAFFAWQHMSWAKHISFNVFCEYILPYRCTNTYADGSRNYFLEKNKQIFDSLKGSPNCFDAGNVMIRDIDSWFVEETQLFKKNPYLRPMKFTDLLKGKVGLCIDATSVKVTALRSLGIPTALDEVPNWGSTNGSHYWYKIVDPLNDTVKFLITNENSTRSTDHIISTSSYWPRNIVFTGIPKAVEVSYIRTVPKVYRNTFEKQTDNLAAIRSKKDEIPEYFINERLKDVTNEYLVSADVKRKLNNAIGNQKFVYLCVYDNYNWKPVAWATIVNNIAIFKNMGKNIVYLPAYYYSGNIIPAGEPFLLNLKGDIVDIAHENKWESVTLYTKYPYRNHINFYQSAIINGRFQFSNKSDLSDSVTIHTIRKLPFYTTEVEVTRLEKFRYLFFQSAGLYFTTFAEVEYFTKNERGEEIRLSGKLIGNKGMYPDTAQKMFDGDLLTCYSREKDKETYVGIDLGENNATTITKIRFVPRTDGNIVSCNEYYELFYWDKNWVSLGSVMAGENSTVTFKKVPTHALLLLKNKKGGIENRIFTYKNGRQLFW